MSYSRKFRYSYALIRAGVLGLSWAASLVLLAFTARRVIFTWAILKPGPQPELKGCLPARKLRLNVLVLVACRDEASLIDPLCNHIERIDYPAERLHVVLIDDGSHDTTRSLMRKCASGTPGWDVLGIDDSVGKAAALNAAVSQYSFGDIVYVLDADHHPQADALNRLERYFDDPLVAGVSGNTKPRNALASPIAYYSAVETMVHQLLTMRAKDRLDLAPALLGSNCAYRRTALSKCGFFRAGALSEDYDLTLAFYTAGWRIRFAPDVISRHEVPETVAGYLKQHARWGRGIYDVARDHAPSVVRSHMPLATRIELLALMAGYIDRAALLLGMALAGLSAWKPQLVSSPNRLLTLASVMPIAQVAALFCEQRVSREMWIRLPLVPLLFVLDVYAALDSLASALLGRPRQWARTVRVADR